MSYLWSWITFIWECIGALVFAWRTRNVMFIQHRITGYVFVAHAIWLPQWAEDWDAYKEGVANALTRIKGD